jgi:hypothetical protein
MSARANAGGAGTVVEFAVTVELASPPKVAPCAISALELTGIARTVMVWVIEYGFGRFETVPLVV